MLQLFFKTRYNERNLFSLFTTLSVILIISLFTSNAISTSLKSQNVSAHINISDTLPSKIIPIDTRQPEVNIRTPEFSTVIKQNSILEITVDATDNTAIDKLEFYVNNNLIAEDEEPPYSTLWSVPSSLGFQYSIKVKAYDTAGNFTVDSVQVTASRE